MVFMPPGSAKSFYANVNFSAWYAGAFPSKKLITASFSQEVADKWGRRVRGIVRTPEYAEMFGAELSNESSAAGRWELSNNSEYYAVGVGGSVTSFRADLGIIDDPVKGREVAESDTLRQKANEWYRDDFWTRLKPEAAVILIMTRWHEEDLAGWLLKEAEKGGEQWEVISLPMEAEDNDPLGRAPGEPLWPEWFTDAMRTEAKRNLTRWSSLYQQRPAPIGGSVIQLGWFGRYHAVPPGGEVVISLDSAYKAKEHNDPSCFQVWRIHGTHAFLERDITERMEYPDLRRKMLELAQEYKPSAVLIEDKASGQALLSDLRAHTALPVIALPALQDKETRARTATPMIEAGRVSIPHHAGWLPDFERELTLFPNAAHDDRVDCMAQFLNWWRERETKDMSYTNLINSLYGVNHA